MSTVLHTPWSDIGFTFRAFGSIALALAGLGCIYTVAAAVLVKRFFYRLDSGTTEFPPITILKPLSGSEPNLHDHLQSFCLQDYPGFVQIIFGVQDPKDSAIQYVHGLQREFPDHDIKLVVDSTEYGANRKISNVINIARHARYDLLVLADSDIEVERTYLRELVSALSKPGIGLVTCLYRGKPMSGVAAQLSAMAIDHHFLPSVIFGLKIKLARPCFGSTIALKRSVLDRIGGFETFADHLADDNAIGEAVRAQGLAVAVPVTVVTHACPEQRITDLLSHELRWARTIRVVDPIGFLGSIVIYPLPLALIGVLLFGPTAGAAAVLGAALCCRSILRYQVDQSLRIRSRLWWLLPLRDLLSFAVFVASLFLSSVHWQGRRYRVTPYGMLSSLKDL